MEKVGLAPTTPSLQGKGTSYLCINPIKKSLPVIRRLLNIMVQCYIYPLIEPPENFPLALSTVMVIIVFIECFSAFIAQRYKNILDYKINLSP